MPSMINSILLAFHVALFIILSGQSKLRVMASPVPVSPTREYLAANHSLRTELNATQDLSPLVSMRFAGRDIPTDPSSTVHSSTPHWLHRRDDAWRYYNQAKQNHKNLQSLAKRSASVGRGDVDFQRNCVSQASAYQINLLELQRLLAQLGSNKGLENYDSTNDLETLLKNTVNLNKDALNTIADIVANIPVLGPLLGPIVYEIKCILDDILNFCENLTDAIINDLQPLLKALIGQASTMACRSGVKLFGLCL